MLMLEDLTVMSLVRTWPGTSVKCLPPSLPGPFITLWSPPLFSLSFLTKHKHQRNTFEEACHLSLRERRLTDPLTSWLLSGARSSACQPPALVSLSSLNPNRFGKQSRRYDRGKTSATTPPSAVLTETTDIIETHTLDGWDNTRTHTYIHAHTIYKFPSYSYTSKHTHWIPLPLPTLLPLFLSAACINQQKSSLCGDVILIDGTWSIFRPFPSLRFLSTCSADLSTQRRGSQTQLTNSQLLP